MWMDVDVIRLTRILLKIGLETEYMVHERLSLDRKTKQGLK